MWAPKLVKIDLTEEKISQKKTIEAKIVENFLGGRGITVYLAYQAIPTDTSPRGADNVIILGTGPITGSIFPSSGMMVATFKSPLTNTLFSSITTGSLGAYLKSANIDFLQINGISKKPCYILIDEFSDITLENAESIWNKSIAESDSWIRKKYGKDSSVAVIGPAAINQITYAGVAVDLNHFFRRGGLGAVFSSKNIKAIVISKKAQVQEIKELTQESIDKVKHLISQNSWFNKLKNRGTFSLIFPTIEKGILPTKNCTRILQLAPDKISSFQGYKDSFNCWQCSINCIRNSYQDFVALGPNLKVVELDPIQKAIELCDSEALDPLSTGAAIASLFNIQEDRRKLLDINLGFSWGNPKILSLISKIITKEGIGDQLSRGEAYLYQQTSEHPPMIKNQMGSMVYYPNILGVSLATSTSPYSASNFRSDHLIFPELFGLPFQLDPRSTRGKVRTLILFEKYQAILDSLIICSRYFPFLVDVQYIISWLPQKVQDILFQFFPNLFIGRLGLDAPILLKFLKNIFDEKLSFNKLLNIGNRINLLERIFNTRMGLGYEEDVFSPFLKKRPDFFKQHEKLVLEYYQQKGLTSKGLVRSQTLNKSGLIGIISI